MSSAPLKECAKRASLWKSTMCFHVFDDGPDVFALYKSAGFAFVDNGSDDDKQPAFANNSASA